MYFYGYLNIILPYKGEHQLGIRNILKEYESKQGIKFETYKLIILLPLSCNCKSSLKDISENIDEAKVYFFNSNFFIRFLCMYFF